MGGAERRICDGVIIIVLVLYMESCIAVFDFGNVKCIEIA